VDSSHSDASGAVQTTRFVSAASGLDAPVKLTASSPGGAPAPAVVFEIASGVVDASDEFVKVTADSGVPIATEMFPAPTDPVIVSRALHVAEAAEGITNADSASKEATATTALTRLRSREGVVPCLMAMPDLRSKQG